LRRFVPQSVFGVDTEVTQVLAISKGGIALFQPAEAQAVQVAEPVVKSHCWVGAVL